MSEWIEQWGSPADHSKPCPICKGSGWLERSTGLFQHASDITARCPCWLIYSSAQQLWHHGFPRAYLKYFWDASWPAQLTDAEWEAFAEVYPTSMAWGMTEAEQQACDFFAGWSKPVRTQGLSLLIHSVKGSGKSALATALAAEVTKRNMDPTGWRGKWQPAWISCESIYEQIGLRGQGIRELTEKAESATLLVLDDLRWQPTGYLAQDLVERLHRILQTRSNNLLPTIITANRAGNDGDLQANSVTAFLGISDKIPERYGRYRMIHLSNDPLRPLAAWSI